MVMKAIGGRGRYRPYLPRRRRSCSRGRDPGWHGARHRDGEPARRLPRRPVPRHRSRWQVSPLAIGLSLAVGLGLTAMASLPALWRAARVPVREALETAGIEADGTGGLDRAVARVRFLPRLSRFGLRSRSPQGPEPGDRSSGRLRRRHRRCLRRGQSHDARDQRADRETRGRRHHRLRRHLVRRPPTPGRGRPRGDAQRRRRRRGSALRPEPRRGRRHRNLGVGTAG